MCAQNPQMRAILTNPDMMREIMTPQNMAAAMGMMQGGGPGGMGAMGGMPGSMPMPGTAGGAGGVRQTSGNAQIDFPAAALHETSRPFAYTSLLIAIYLSGNIAAAGQLGRLHHC